MDVYKAIINRRTVRDFDGRPISTGIVERLISAGLAAPTNDHMRSWEFVVVNDKAARARLLSEVLGTTAPTSAGISEIINAWGITDTRAIDMYMDAIPKQYAMLYNAGCLILPFFKDGTKVFAEQKTVTLQTISALNCFASIWCCVENILIAAAAEGIFGVTRISLGDEQAHVKRSVGAPDTYIMPCYIALGYPAKNAPTIEQNKFNPQDKIHINKW